MADGEGKRSVGIESIAACQHFIISMLHYGNVPTFMLLSHVLTQSDGSTRRFIRSIEFVAT